ncbi:MAG TPA: MarR family transcriptional regulator [Pyrinomonadaceae bacterium]
MSPTPPKRKREAARADSFAESFEDRLDVSRLAPGGLLFGREAGHRVYKVAFQSLRRLPKEGVLLVDLSRVRQASNQALKEALSVVDVLRTAKFEERFILFLVDERNRDLCESVEIVARHGGDVLPAVGRGGARIHFGKLTAAERETLKAVERYGELTSRELRERLGLLPSAASNRLRRLHHLRLIRRDERAVSGSGGREFVYRPLVRPGARRAAAGRGLK